MYGGGDEAGVEGADGTRTGGGGGAVQETTSGVVGAGVLG